MKIAVMIPMDKAAMADGTLWPMAWNNDGGSVFGTYFPELDHRDVASCPRFPEEAAAHAQKEIEEFFSVGHGRMFLETRSEAVLERVREMVRTRKEFEASVYLVRGNAQGVLEERFDILPDGSIQPPLVLGKVSSQAPATCTGSTAVWCPVHGDCACPNVNDDPQEGPTLDDASCPLHAPTSTHGEEGGREVSFELGEVDHHGELELILEVNGAKDSAWLSKEMWERMGEVAGWRPAPSVDTKKIERLIRDVEKAAKDGHNSEQHRLAARLDSSAEMLRSLLPLVEEQRRTINEGIEITHDQAIKIEQLEETLKVLTGHVRERFIKLRTSWYLATGHLSNPHKIIDHPTYHAIVALGWPVVPYLLGDLVGDDPCHFWGQALHAITGELIEIPREDYGKGRVIAAAWLELAKKKGWSVCPTEKKPL